MFKKDIKYHHKIATEIVKSGAFEILEHLQNHEDKHIRKFAKAFYQPIYENLAAQENDATRTFHDEF
uniref:Uncharacterized protein n=1 Tax=Panagrolaimus sp. ES5 TaxID=591445 RepID=A0AC34FXE5_9BILA